MIKLLSILYFIPALISIFCILRHDIITNQFSPFTFTKMLVSIIPGLNILVSVFEVLSWFIGYDRAYKVFVKEM